MISNNTPSPLVLDGITYSPEKKEVSALFQVDNIASSDSGTYVLHVGVGDVKLQTDPVVVKVLGESWEEHPSLSIPLSDYRAEF